MKAELAISSFLGSLRSAGIAVLQGICILDSFDRVSSEAAIPAASQARLAGRSPGWGELQGRSLALRLCHQPRHGLMTQFP